MLITPKHLAKSIECPKLLIGEHEVQPSPHVRNLGVTMDSMATMEKHVNNVCRASYMQLFNINRIKKHLDRSSLELVVHDFITSKLDFGNALLCGYPQSLIHKLQRVQNVAARILTGQSKYSHITPILKELHWLPVTQWIKYKIAILVFKAKCHLAPIYLQELIQPHTSLRALRSTDQELLHVPFTKSAMVRQKAFAYAGPCLWNSLPIELRRAKDLVTFKRLLKTHLFVQHYA